MGASKLHRSGRGYPGKHKCLIIVKEIGVMTVDKIFTKAKKGNIHGRRQIDAILNSRQLTNKVVDELAPKTKRDSGYTRITRLGKRSGDNASMARLEFVDQIYIEPTKDKKDTKPKSQPTTKNSSTKKTSAAKTSQKKNPKPKASDTKKTNKS